MALVDATVARRIIDLRMQGWTQRRIAAELGLSPQTISKALRNPQVQTIVRELEEDARTAMRAAAMDLATEALGTLKDLMGAGNDARIRMQAATEVLDRIGLTKDTAVTVTHVGQVDHRHGHIHTAISPDEAARMTDQQIEAALARLRAPQAFPTAQEAQAHALEDFSAEEVEHAAPPADVWG